MLAETEFILTLVFIAVILVILLAGDWLYEQYRLYQQKKAWRLRDEQNALRK